MIRLSDRVHKHDPSVTGELSGKVDELRRAGVNVINFSIGEPDFELTPAHVSVGLARKRLTKAIPHYTPIPGIIRCAKPCVQSCCVK